MKRRCRPPRPANRHPIARLPPFSAKPSPNAAASRAPVDRWGGRRIHQMPSAQPGHTGEHRRASRYATVLSWRPSGTAADRARSRAALSQPPRRPLKCEADSIPPPKQPDRRTMKSVSPKKSGTTDPCRLILHVKLDAGRPDPCHYARFLSRLRLPISAISIGPSENSPASALRVSPRR